MATQTKHSYDHFSEGTMQHQDPRSPNDDPGQQNPKLPDVPSDTPRPQSDPGKQPIDL